MIFVGETPGGRSGPVLGGACGRRLSALAGVPEAELRRTCAFVNLLPDRPPLQRSGGRAGKGRTFDADRGKVAAAVALRRFLRRFRAIPETIRREGKRHA